MKKYLLIISLFTSIVANAAEYACPESVICSGDWYTSCEVLDSNWEVDPDRTSYTLTPRATYKLASIGYANDPFYSNSYRKAYCTYEYTSTPDQPWNRVGLKAAIPMTVFNPNNSWAWYEASQLSAHCRTLNCKFTDSNSPISKKN